MKKVFALLMSLFIITSCATNKPKQSFDLKDRPSSRGRLQVIDGKLCGEDKQSVMLRGVSNNGVSISERYIKNDTFKEISQKIGANVIRLALYTWGFGSVGYCTGGDKKRLMKDIDDSIQYAINNDMYVIVDWHVLQDKDPNLYSDEAAVFFEEISEKYHDLDNIIYEICNEPNHVEWSDIKNYAEKIIPLIRKNDPDSLIIVGTPEWSQDVDTAADDPLDYDNLLYTLHFYSYSHKQKLRDKAQYALNKKLPIFVSEFGITAASGSLPYDIDEADVWIEFLEDRKISYVMWQFSKVNEASAMIDTNCLKTKDFMEEDFTPAGKWLIDTIAKYSKR